MSWPGPRRALAEKGEYPRKEVIKRVSLDIDDDAAFFAVLKALLDLGENPRPRGYDKLEGSEGIYRVWVGRDWRVLYSIHRDRNELTVEAVRKKDEGTYRQL